MNHAQIEDVYPLSPMQQGILFHSLYAPETAVYFEQLSCELQGDLDVAAFAQAWRRAVARHSILRTAFVWEEMERPLQVVYRHVELPVEEFDWRGRTPAEQRRDLAAFLTEDRRRGFDLSRAPLMRLALIRLADGARQLVWSHHHLLLDGWSMSQLLREVFGGYAAFSQGREPRLTPARPYRDFIAWLQEQNLDRAESFWRAALEGFTAPPALDLPKAQAEDRADGYGELLVHLSQETTAALKTLAREHQLTLNTIAQGAWALLLSRYNGQRDVVFGATVAGRPAELAGVETMIGLFINTLPVRVRVSPEAETLDWLRRLQAWQVEAREYEHMPLANIQRVWQSESEEMRDATLFETLLVFENYPVESALREQLLSQTGLQIREARAFERTNYPLTILAAANQNFSLRALYDRSRFNAASVERTLEHLGALLQAIATEPRRRLFELTMGASDERRKLLVEWSGSASDYLPRCAHQLVEEQAARTPNAVAVTFEDDRLTYAELDRRANQLARYLRGLGVGPESRVGVCLERSIAIVVGALGALKAGAAYVPLDASYPRERLDFMLADAAAQVLLTQRSLADRLPERGARLVLLDADWESVSRESAEPFDSGATPENLAYVIYTSGSTGQPKGVAMPHRALVNLLCWQLRNSRLVGNARTLQFAPLSFDVSFQEIFSTWVAGGELALVRDELRRDSESLWRYLRERRIARLFLPFVALQDLAEASAAIADLPEELSEVITAGEQLHVTRQVAELFGRLAGSQLHNQYGPTESHVVTSHSLSGAASEWVPLPPIGRPIDNSRVYVLDRDLNLAPIGVAGEIHISGVNVARGYLNRPDLTAERFIPDLFSGQAGERLYRTGDLARYLPNGEIEFLGRDDHQVKIRGFRVELGEVEAALMKHTAVKNAVVLARAHASGRRRLTAYIVAATAAQPSINELREFLRERLPEYMSPAAFVFLDALPMTPSGKVDRRALPAPEASRPDLAEAFIAARTPVEEMLAEIWRQTLDVEQVGARDNFFELGGHSLLATQLISRVRAAFNIELPLRALFDSPTAAGLAARIEQELRSGRCAPPPIIALARNGPSPLSFAQRRLWFLDQLEPGGALYNLPLAIRFTGRLDLTALENSLSEVARRHDVLRTTFDPVNGEPVAVVADAAPSKLPITDLTAFPPEEREAEARRLAREEARQPFDLTRGPLAHARALRLSDEDHVVLFTMHHIISDGWSMGALAHEMTALYRAVAQGEPSPLAELPIQYADYAEWQRGLLQGEFLTEQLEYWKKRLAGAPSTSGIPADRPRPARLSANGAIASIDFSLETSTAIKAFAREENATLFMTLLAAFLALFARYTGQTDVCVGTPIAGRQRGETESLIGFFVNTLALRVDLSGAPTFIELLGRVRDVCLGAYAHQDLPFERLVEELQPERDLSRTPLFQVMFALQNAPRRNLELPDVELSMMEIETGAAKFELTLVVADRPHGLRVTAEYNSDLYEAATVRRLLSSYERLLAAAVADPELRLANLPLLDEPERRRLLVECNQTQRAYPQDHPLHTWFAAQAAETPNRIAVECAAERVTYAELNARADRLALRLRRLGVGPEVVVALLCDHSVELLVALLGALKAGGAYLPLDPSSPPQRLAFMLDDAGASLVLTRESLRDRLPSVEAEVICLDEVVATADEGAGKPGPSAPTVSPENLAYMIYTSGSSGEPKGVMVTHRGLSNYLRWSVEAYRMKEGVGAPLHSSVAFDLSVTSLFGPLLSGGRVVMASGEAGGAESLAEALRGGERFSLVKVTPSHARLLGEQMKGERVGVGALVVGGEALRGCDVEAWREMAPEAELVNEYGPTEAVVGCCVYRRRLGELSVGAEEAIPIGRPIANARLYVLDGEMEPAPVGVAGELYIGGVGVGRGYMNRPGLTAERFVPDPFAGEEGARMYRTGDVARHRGDGELEYLGRVDEQVKVRGYRVEPGEIEAVLRGRPEVREAVVTAQRDDLGQQRLIAFLVFNETETASAPPTTNQLREYLAGRLPEYMIPSAFVQLSALPLTTNGKQDRRALQARAGSAPQLKVEHIAPRTPTEETLARIFVEVLGVERVGVHDGFFALGGHSLLATRTISLARAAFQLEIPLRSLFEHPTVAGLASVIEKMQIERIGETGLAEIMERLDHLSEAEAEALLAEKKNAKDGGAAYA